jgi:Piezo non-specific cation channel, R-Ras-binding domain
MIFILFLIAGPMLLFSTINPVGQANPVSSGEMTFYFKISNIEEGLNLDVPLFTTTQLTKNQTLTEA